MRKWTQGCNEIYYELQGVNSKTTRQYIGAGGYHTYPNGSPYAGANNIIAQSGTGNPASEINNRTTLKNISSYMYSVWFTEVCCGGLPLFSMDLARASAIHRMPFIRNLSGDLVTDYSFLWKVK